jgi:diketogulonate reductase-like aldo/keto reductase
MILRVVFRSIGVSNFGVQHLEILLASAKIKPVANQVIYYSRVSAKAHPLIPSLDLSKIELHPYVFLQQLPILEYCAKHKIVIEAYTALLFVSSTFLGGNIDLILTH